jgi:flagellar biosynthesis protein FlhF
MSATTKYEDLKDIYNNFSILPIDTCIFTKLDETTSLGNIFSLIYSVKKPISYLSIGQEVPDDLMVADSDYLVNKILKDIK